MKNKKWEIPMFSFYDHTGMEHHLEKRARQGWLLEKMSGLGWTYRRIPPQPLTYTVSYFNQESLYEPEPSEQRQNFQNFCEHAGWKLAAASPWAQVFYNERPDPVPIETDPELELASIQRAAKKALPAYIMTILAGIWLGGGWIWQFILDPVDLLVSPNWAATGFCFGLLAVYMVTDLVFYYRWRRKAIRAAQHGEFLPTRGLYKLHYVLLVLSAVSFVYWALMVTTPGLRGVILIYLLLIAVLSALTAWVRRTLQRRRVSAGVNRGVTLAVSIGLSLALFSALFIGMFAAIRNGWVRLDGDVHTSTTYEWNGQTVVAYSDPLPLTVEDLTGITAEGYSRHWETEASLLLKREKGEQRARYDVEEDLPRLEYVRYTTRFSAIYELCLNELLRDHEDWNVPGTPSEQWMQYRPIDAAAWGAQNAWQLYMGSEPMDCYILTWPDRIVQLEPDWLLDEEQMAIAGQKLAA